MFNLELHTPTVAGLEFYGTAGGGLYRERLADHQVTAFGANVGGGVKVTVVGPVGMRFDYQAYSLSGDALHDRTQRVYAGLNVAFLTEDVARRPEPRVAPRESGAARPTRHLPESD